MPFSRLFSAHRSGIVRLAFALVAASVLGLPALSQAETRTSNMWWTPQAVTTGGHEIDFLLMFIFWLTLAVFIITQTVYIVFIVKYRQRKGVKAVYSHGNNVLEVVWTATPALIFILLAVWSDRVWLQLRGKVPENAVTIDIVAYQFGFHIRNPGVDGKLGSYSQEWMKVGDNNFGLDQTKDDPNGHDDYSEENQLTLPVNRPVNVILRSQDVIHAFYVPEFRMYQDILPGRIISWVWFTPEKEGHYALACNQLCGSGHFNMQAKIDVVSEGDYDKLVAEKSAAAVKKHDEKAKAAAAPAAANAAVNARVPATPVSAPAPAADSHPGAVPAPVSASNAPEPVIAAVH